MADKLCDVLIATPSHSGDVSCSYATSLLGTIATLGVQHGLSCSPFFLMGNAVISYARALCVHKFMECGADYLLFIDADLGWSPEGAAALVKSPHEFVAGVYPAKVVQENKVFMTRGLRETATKNYLETDGVPGGFMRLKRSVIEKMIEAYPETKVTYRKGSPQAKDVYLLFENMVVDGEPLGEDYAFCERWRRIGGKIFVDPGLPFAHFGRGEWRGCMIEDDKRLSVVE
jgi:glycosyltransferase involved in cell wall biosynthesis